MKPIKNKDWFYFILREKNDFGFDYETSLRSKVLYLNKFKDSEEYVILDLFMPQSIHHFPARGIIDSIALGATHYQLPIKIMYLEEVIDHTCYQNSVQFTLGSSTIKREEKKYLVGILINKEHAEETFNRNITHHTYKITMDDFDKVGLIMNIPKRDALGYFNEPKMSLNIGSEFLGHAKNRWDVEHFSYDEHFKYYTLLC